MIGVDMEMRRKIRSISDEGSHGLEEIGTYLSSIIMLCHGARVPLSHDQRQATADSTRQLADIWLYRLSI